MGQNDESTKATDTSACAPSAATPAGDILLRWKWVERSVWTGRMLVALERGLKGGKEHSYGFRPGRSAQGAVARVEGLLRDGYTWIVDADIKSYFDAIPQGLLLRRLAERVSDRRLLRLIGQSLRAGVLEEMKGWQPTEQGTPQGGVLSPLLANIYLNPLDHQMAQAGYRMTRYADDFVIQCQNRAEAQAALERVRAWMTQAGLTLHPDKTRIVDATQEGGFEFLGWHFERGYQWPRTKSQAKVKETIRQHTPRNSGKGMREIVHRLNHSLRSWRAYFDHGVRNVYEDLDKMVRRRLRQLLLKRRGKRGKPNGLINQKWPNAYFDKLGLWRLAGTP
jgi:RNA-directed DNA polymerase